MISGESLVQALVAGLMLGGLYGLITLGLSITYGVMRIINFAHGEFLMLGLYIAYFLTANAGWDPYLTAFATVPALFVIGVVIFRGTIFRVLRAPLMNQVILTMGLAILIQGLVMAGLGADVRSTNTRYSLMTWDVGYLNIGVAQLIAAIVSIAAFAAVWVLLQFTRFGRALRAASQNAAAAELCAINTRRIYLLAFGLGSALVGLSASLMIPYYAVYPTVGGYLGLIAFFVIILGGTASITGCLIGGAIIGLSESLGAALLPGSFARVLTFSLFLAFLLLRPEGIITKGRS